MTSMHVLRTTVATLVLLAMLVPAAEALATMSRIEASTLGTTISCVALSGGQISCRACVGPGETEEYPVEPQGGGIAVGVPGEPGAYAEQDVLNAQATCA